MISCRLQVMSKASLLLTILTAIASTPVLANTANFGKLAVSPGFDPTKGTVGGYTGGSYSLSAISNRAHNRNACIGFADPNPDHILVLEKDFSRLKLLVQTGGSDTTLLVQGPDSGMIRCGDDTGKSKDASIEDSNWKAGTYRVWVGTFNPGEKRNYTLSVHEQ